MSDDLDAKIKNLMRERMCTDAVCGYPREDSCGCYAAFCEIARAAHKKADAKLAKMQAVVDAARRCVKNPAWQGVCDEDVLLERALAALDREGGNV